MPIANISDHLGRNVEATCKVNTTFVRCTDFSYGTFGEFWRASDFSSAPNVLCLCNWLKMVWVDAWGVVTEMVYYESFWDLTKFPRIEMSMSTY